MLNENIAYARSILNRLDIKSGSDEYSDYLKIREICGQNNGYVGILTKLRFLDDVKDLDELESIFDVLKDSKIDINKLNKLSYNEILDLFYDDLVGDKSKDDYEFIFKDDHYSYYRVYTYNGILEIGSPAWCLKTKSHWDRYYEKLTEVWVVIDNNYKGKLITPNSNYFGEYKNNKKPWVRYGVSIDPVDNSFVAFSDGNVKVDRNASNFTFFGVINTIKNLRSGIYLSFNKEFYGCENINKSFLKVVDKDKFIDRVFYKNEDKLKLANNILIDKPEEMYVYLDYNQPTIIFYIGSVYIYYYYLYENVKDKFVSKPLEIKVDNKILKEYIKEARSVIYSGFRLKNGFLDMDTIIKSDKFLDKIDNWLIFNANDFYIIVNTLENLTHVEIPTVNFDKMNDELENPAFFYIRKSDMKPHIFGEVSIKDYHLKVINFLKSKNLPIENKGKSKNLPIENKGKSKKVKGFFDFLKRKK